MPLSNEDNLRLNVLIAQKPRAIRINESTMAIHALTAKGEAKVVLNPNCRDMQYLKQVRELLSMKITGSPGGYPVFTKRWTRMGQERINVEHLLLLGEPEAVVAVAQSPNISHDIGERVWWADPSVENARSLLTNPNIAKGKLGKEIAQFLLEFLPFEERQVDIVHSVRLCLQPDLINDKEKKALWQRAKRKNAYYVGFLMGAADALPIKREAHPCHNALAAKLQALHNDKTQNLVAADVLRILSPQGQAWLATLGLALKKPTDQDVVIALFIGIDAYFHTHFPEYRGVREISTAIERAEKLCQNPQSHEASEELLAVITQMGDDLPLLEAMLIIAQLGEDTLNPIFGGCDAVGSVMRKYLAPLTTPLLERVDALLP